MTGRLSKATSARNTANTNPMGKEEQKKLITEIMNEDQKDGLYKQTAVEWLEAHLIEYGFDLSLHKIEIEQAKQMEKQQQGYNEEEVLQIIKNAFNQGERYGWDTQASIGNIDEMRSKIPFTSLEKYLETFKPE